MSKLKMFDSNNALCHHCCDLTLQPQSSSPSLSSLLNKKQERSTASIRSATYISLISFALILAYLSKTTLAQLEQYDGANQNYNNNNNNNETISDAARVALESWRTKPNDMSQTIDTPSVDQLAVNVSNAFEVLFKKKPYSKYWTPEQKWDDLFKRFIAVQGTLKQIMMKSFMRDIEHYADVTISHQCKQDLEFIQNYVSRSTNFRWLMHMIDATGKSEPGMLTGNLAHLGHVVQCIKIRAPARPTNITFDERYFEKQTELLGERFRGKYCLASIRPVLPTKPKLISRFNEIINESLVSNISYTGEPIELLKLRAKQFSIPSSVYNSIDREHLRLDQVPFESELYQSFIMQRNFMFTLPRFMGVCYPSSCSRDDVRMSLQKTLDDKHQVVDVEFECEQEEKHAWQWFSTPRLVAYVFLILFAMVIFGSSLARYILVDQMKIKKSKLKSNNQLAIIIGALDMLSMDKCAGILFVKTKRASPFVDWSKVENNRSTSIDALKGFLILMLTYSQLTMLNCLPVPFMWSKWGDAMFPFYRSLITQIFLNTTIWTEAFYIISAYLICTKLLENFRPTIGGKKASPPMPNLVSYILKRYIRLTMPMVAFILLNYVWPRLSNGFVMQDQANKLLAPCDSYAWTNMLLFHNYYNLNETCVWPSHVSASLFQLHLISYPIILLCLYSLRARFDASYEKKRHIAEKIFTCLAIAFIILLATIGIVYPAFVATNQELIVPFLIDYIDFDNYQRVIEWMVLPTYNHLTSYMIGIVVAFVVVRKRTDLEFRRASSSDWSGHYIHREPSFESVRSSSTQDLQSGPNFHNLDGKINLFSSNTYASSQKELIEKTQMAPTCWLWDLLKSGLALIILMVSLVASWFWNGLGQPITSQQTFLYVCLTKICFCLTFAYLFYKHFATRKNSNNPWMITRFLVPIGRMSLMVFYMSWLVIWFDLLSSPYQWHPSHYFISEKYNEIIFMTLVLSMFAYGAFEGIIKRIQYAGKLERIKSDECQSMQLPTTISSIKNNFQRKQQVKGFESFFHPVNRKIDNQPFGNSRLTTGETLAESSLAKQQQANPNFRQHLPASQVPSTFGDDSGKLASGSTSYLTAGSGNQHLSAADQCKLNAELRANYSFASIGLYESAGATGDLSQLSSDPQVSPMPSHRRS